jgi:hypothetical protein
MSLNLVFLVKGGGIVEFPIQTPTKVTLAVLNAKSVRKRLSIINEELKTWEWTKEGRKETMKKIRVLMSNPELTLKMW